MNEFPAIRTMLPMPFAQESYRYCQRPKQHAHYEGATTFSLLRAYGRGEKAAEQPPKKDYHLLPPPKTQQIKLGFRK